MRESPAEYGRVGNYAFGWQDEKQIEAAVLHSAGFFPHSIDIARLFKCFSNIFFIYHDSFLHLFNPTDVPTAVTLSGLFAGGDWESTG